MNKRTIPIQYNGFYDAPLSFWANYKGKVYFFWRGYYDEHLDDFSSEYEVFIMKDSLSKDESTNWETLQEKEKDFIGKIHMEKIIFDSTKRKNIDEQTFQFLVKQ